MPKQEILPTWTSLNNANFTSRAACPIRFQAAL